MKSAENKKRDSCEEIQKTPRGPFCSALGLDLFYLSHPFLTESARRCGEALRRTAAVGKSLDSDASRRQRRVNAAASRAAFGGSR